MCESFEPYLPLKMFDYFLEIDFGVTCSVIYHLLIFEGMILVPVLFLRTEVLMINCNMSSKSVSRIRFFLYYP